MRLPLVGGSGKDSNRIALGAMRTLTPATAGRTYGEWVESVRTGRTAVTNGPLVRFSVDGNEFATAIKLEREGTIQLRAEVASVVEFDRLELVANGSVIASSRPTGDGILTANLDAEHVLSDGGWVAARCWGTGKPGLYPHVPTFAHTSPVFVEVAGQPLRRRPEAVAALRREVEAVRHWIETEGRFTVPRRKEHLLALCAAALERL